MEHLRRMEKVQIARYALMQITALVYAILTCGAAVKLSAWKVEIGRPLPEAYFWAVFMRDYGLLFSPLILLWVFWVSYRTVVLCEEPPSWWSYAAIGLCFIFFAGSTFIALGTLLGSFS